jgi:hypothetical protein
MADIFTLKLEVEVGETTGVDVGKGGEVSGENPHG